VVIVTIGTPVDEHLNPQLSMVEGCIKSLVPYLHDGQTLLLRSTLFPGTSARIRTILQSAGLDVGVSFCPERIAQGYAIDEIKQLPQIVSGSSAKATQHAKGLFSTLGVDLIELDLQEAEIAKLFLNAWRYVVFATANQFYQIALAKNLNFERIRAAICYRYERAACFPRTGFTAGPCLFKDTMQLAAFCRHQFTLGHAAMLVNETMPDCMLEQAKAELAKNNCSIATSTCGILGMAFKPDNDDIRESLAFKLRRLLRWEAAEVYCSDPHIVDSEFVDVHLLLKVCSVIFIGCPHTEYKNLKFMREHVVIDCWGSLPQASLAVFSASDSSCILESRVQC